MAQSLEGAPWDEETLTTTILNHNPHYSFILLVLHIALSLYLQLKTDLFMCMDVLCNCLLPKITEKQLCATKIGAKG